MRRVAELSPLRPSRIALFATLLVGTVPADAQEADERVERARVLFERAEADFAAQQYPAAAAGYRESYELLREAGRSTAPLVLYNVGLAWERAGERDRALEAYRQFVRDATPDDEETRRRVADARARLAALAPAPSQSPAAAETTTVPAGSETASSRSRISPVGPVILGAGVLIVGAGAVFGAVALTTESDLRDRCGGTACPDTPENRSQYDQMRTFGAVADVLLIVGAVTAITGSVLTFTLTESGESETRVSAMVRSAGLGLAVSGTF